MELPSLHGIDLRSSIASIRLNLNDIFQALSFLPFTGISSSTLKHYHPFLGLIFTLSGFFPTSDHSISFFIFSSTWPLNNGFPPGLGPGPLPQKNLIYPWPWPLYSSTSCLLDIFVWMPYRYLKVGTSPQGSQAPWMAHHSSSSCAN